MLLYQLCHFIDLCTCGIYLHFFYYFSHSNVEAYLQEHQLKLIQVQGDGHCIAHAASKAITSKRTEAISSAEIIDLICNEAFEHLPFYKEYSTSGSNLINDLMAWAADKDYQNANVDLVLYMLANAMQVSVMVVEEAYNKVTETTVSPRPGVANTGMIRLLREGDHYSTCIHVSDADMDGSKYDATETGKSSHNTANDDLYIPLSCSDSDTDSRVHILSSNKDGENKMSFQVERESARDSFTEEHKSAKDKASSLQANMNGNVTIHSLISDDSGEENWIPVKKFCKAHTSEDERPTIKIENRYSVLEEDALVISSDSDAEDTNQSQGNATSSSMSETKSIPQIKKGGIEYLHGNKHLPVYQRKSNLSTHEIFQIIMDNKAGQQFVCTQKPVSCQEDATFVVDTTNMSHASDLLADDNGKWTWSDPSRYFHVTFNSLGEFHK